MKSIKIIAIVLGILIAAILMGQSVVRKSAPVLSGRAGVPKEINYQGLLKIDTLGVNDTLDMTFSIWDDPSAGNQKWSEIQYNVIVDKGLFNVTLGSETTIPDSVFRETERWLQLEIGGQPFQPRTKITSIGYSYRAYRADTADYAIAIQRPITPLIATSEIADGAVTMPKINQSGATTGEVIKWTGAAWSPSPDSTGGPPTGPAGGDLTGTYPNPTIANNAVNSGKIQDGQVSTADLANSAVTNTKLANNAVTSIKILDGAVTMSKINQSGATTGEVIKWTGSAWAPGSDSAVGPPTGPAGGDLTGTYPNPTIANNAVTSAKIQDGTITSADIGNGQVSNADLANSAVTNAKLAGNAVTTGKIQDGTIVNADISSSAGISDTKLSGTGTWISNFNADMLDGQHASAFLTTSSDYGRSGVSSTLYEGSTPLSNKYFSWATSWSGSGTGLELASGNSYAIVGITDAAGFPAVFGRNNSSQAVGALGMGSYGIYTERGTGSYAGYFESGSNGGPGIYVRGNIGKTGTCSAIEKTSKGYEWLYAIEGPDVEYVESGVATVRNGVVRVEFDRLFSEVISREIPVRVTVSPQSRWAPLYVEESNYQGFTVKVWERFTGDKDNITFTWIAIARRKGYENRPDKTEESKIVERIIRMSKTGD